MEVYILSSRNKRARAYAKAQANQIAAGNRKPIPYQDLIAEYLSTHPTSAEGIGNIAASYYRTFILKKLMALFEFKNTPKNWDIDYLKLGLLSNGVMCITDTEIGVIPLMCNTAGVSVFNRPTNVIIANPVLGNLERIIANQDVAQYGINAISGNLKPAALLYLQFDYAGIEPLIRRYSYFLAQCDGSLSSTLYNSRVAFIGKARDKSQADTIKKMYQDISEGKPSVIVSDDISDRWEILNVKNSYVGIEILETRRRIVNEMLTEIGINNGNMEKKEREISDEVNSNNIEIQMNVHHWLTNLKSGIEVANRLYGLNVRVDLSPIVLQSKEVEDESNKPL